MLEVIDIYKSYEGSPLLRGITFQVQAGETICLLGASGSGKSTLLRIISGLEEAEQGRVLWDGEDLAQVPVHQRNFGLMFQDYALFPHRNVAENVAFGLRMQGLPKSEIANRVQEALTRVNLSDFADRRVTDLSGGEQQRVALARALAPRPRLLMLDEPLGALDRALREQLGEFLREVLHRTGIPAIYVTHDQTEAFAIADRLILLHDGRIEQSGSPAEVYQFPASTWVAGFFGLTNILPGTVLSLQPVRIQTPLGVFIPDRCTGNSLKAGAAVQLLFYPTGWQLSTGEKDQNLISGRVDDSVFHGEHHRVSITSGQYHFYFDQDEPLPSGQTASFSIQPDALVCLEEAHAHG